MKMSKKTATAALATAALLAIGAGALPAAASAAATTTTFATLPAGSSPHGIAVDSSGNVFTANYGNGTGSGTVSKITPLGILTAVFGTTGTAPEGIAVDSAGNVYTANSGSNDVTPYATTLVNPHVASAATANPARTEVTLSKTDITI